NSLLHSRASSQLIGHSRNCAIKSNSTSPKRDMNPTSFNSRTNQELFLWRNNLSRGHIMCLVWINQEEDQDLPVSRLRTFLEREWSNLMLEDIRNRNTEILMNADIS